MEMLLRSSRSLKAGTHSFIYFGQRLSATNIAINERFDALRECQASGSAALRRMKLNFLVISGDLACCGPPFLARPARPQCNVVLGG
jgi:hypothetical protein